MNEMMLFLSLSVSSPAAAPCCQPRPALLQAAAEAKEVRENIGHFVSPAILTASFYGTALYFGASRSQARWISVGTSLGLVVAKELYDRSVAGRFGLEEAGIGVVGTAAGLWMAEQMEWAEPKRVR